MKASGNPLFSSKGAAKPSCLLFLLLLSLNSLLCYSASADEIFTSTSGVTFGRSSREPKYKIEFHPANAPFHPDNGQESMAMSNKEGQNFVCFLPIVEETKSMKSITQQNTSNIIVETDKRIKLKTPDELLEVLKDKCFYRHEGWWSYEFCYQKKLRQLHVEEDNIVQEFVLGVFDPEATAAFNEKHSDISTLKDPRSKDASQRYHTHWYTNGTICDLTNQPRETEVWFVCSEPTVIFSSIKEISTCKYAITIQCPMLCKHPMFQQERPMWHTIHCNEMPRDIKDPLVEDGFKGKQITIVTDDPEQYAT